MINQRADLHGHAVDFACDQDRRYFRENPSAKAYHRDPVEHELCVPGGPCLDLAGRQIEVIALTGGRMRRVAEQPAS